MSDRAPARNPPGPRASFPTTRWTIVREMADGVRRVRFVAWDEFVIAYQNPLLIWMGKRCGNVSLAEELVQSFLVKILEKEHAVAGLDASKGRLRTWLLISLQRHWVDHHRRQGPAGMMLSEDLVAREAAGDEEYDRDWAHSIAQRVLVQLHDEYAARGSMPLFTALLELIDDPKQDLRADCCERLGMTSNTFSVALMRFRERLAVRLREEVAATVFGNRSQDIDEELRYLVTILSRSEGLTSLMEMK